MRVRFEPILLILFLNGSNETREFVILSRYSKHVCNHV